MARRQPRLTSIASVLRELGRQYRRADQGELPWIDCSAAARVLREARHCLEGADIERRLAALERALSQQHQQHGHRQVDDLTDAEAVEEWRRLANGSNGHARR